MSSGSEPRHISRSSGRPVWLALEPDPVLGFLHLPEPVNSGLTAVLICPPFGWEDMCSYRGRRAWAGALAQAGYLAMRIDLPGTGDSAGSPRDPGRLDSWTGAVSSAAAWLHETTACSRVTAIGIGLGGMLACSSVAIGAPIDDLILWAVPASGQTLLRELRMQAAVIAARHPDDAHGSPRPPDGAVEAVGFLISAETTRELEGLQLTNQPLPHAAGRRVLLLGRDRLNVDRRLRAYFEQAGAHVTVTEGSDYGTLMAPPQEARAPLQTISETLSWLTDGPSSSPARVGDAVAWTPLDVGRHSIELSYQETAIRESPLCFEIGPGQLFGVLSEPVDVELAPVCGVLLNGGALRHIGPNRIWVELARRWAGGGVPTIRIDLEGIGDSDGDEERYVENAGFYVPQMIQQTVAVLGELAARGLPKRFVLVGLCSGAYWALHAALSDARVAGAFMVNLYPVYWSDALIAEHTTRQALVMLRGEGWRRLARREVSVDQLRTAIRSMRHTGSLVGARNSVESSDTERVEAALDQLRDQGTEALILLSQDEPLHGQFVRQGQIERLERWPNLSLERIPSRDHMFRAPRLQRHVHDSLDRALHRVLTAASSESLSSHTHSTERRS